MTIKVESASIPVADVKPADAASEGTQSAPVTEVTEHNSATESDTVESEAVEEDKDDSEVEGDEPDSKDIEKDKPKAKKGGWQRKIDKKTREATEARAEAEYWKQQALKSAGESKTPAEAVEKPQADVIGKPNPDSFETYAEYTEALTDWKLEQREKAAKEQAAKSQLETEHQKQMSAHSERVNSFKKKTSDFDDVLESVDDVHVSPTVAQLIVESENGPDLMYELAKNRAEYERINSLPPLAAAREIGRIESRFASHAQDEKKPEPKKLTNAPKPIGPVGSAGKGLVAKSISDPNLTQAEYERLRREQMQKQG